MAVMVLISELNHDHVDLCTLEDNGFVLTRITNTHDSSSGDEWGKEECHLKVQGFKDPGQTF